MHRQHTGSPLLHCQGSYNTIKVVHGDNVGVCLQVLVMQPNTTAVLSFQMTQAAVYYGGIGTCNFNTTVNYAVRSHLREMITMCSTGNLSATPAACDCMRRPCVGNKGKVVGALSNS